MLLVLLSISAGLGGNRIEEKRYKEMKGGGGGDQIDEIRPTGW